MKAILVFVATALLLGSCARQDWIDRTLVTENVTGVWRGSTTGLSAGTRVQLELVQEGAKVTGTINRSVSGTSGAYSGPVEGSVSGDVFSFKEARGAYSGELTVAGDDMEGSLQGPAGNVGVSLHRASQR